MGKPSAPKEPTLRLLLIRRRSEVEGLLGKPPAFDLAVVDMKGHEADAMWCIEQLRQMQPQAGVLTVSAYDDEDLAVAGFAAGANGYMSRSSTVGDFFDALALVARGGTHIPARLTSSFLYGLRRRLRLPGDSRVELSERQRQILSLLANGRTNKEIGKRIHVAEATVKSHLYKLFRIMKVSNRTQLIAEARRQGLLSSLHGRAS
jgi:DNA-binding NarL/FixJ family response regulator